MELAKEVMLEILALKTNNVLLITIAGKFQVMVSVGNFAPQQNQKENPALMIGNARINMFALRLIVEIQGLASKDGPYQKDNSLQIRGCAIVDS